MKKGELHVISTDRQPAKQLAEIAGDIHPYINAIHLREKTKTAKEIYELVTLLTDNQVPLSKIIINDRLDVACVKQVVGVQLAYHSLSLDVVKKEFPHFKIGCSVHSSEEGEAAEKLGADYVLFGHVFPTNSKPGKTPKGLQGLNKVSQSVTIPVIAIGGITPANTEQVLHHGAKGIAVMSGVLEANDPLAAVQSYQAKLSG